MAAPDPDPAHRDRDKRDRAARPTQAVRLVRLVYGPGRTAVRFRLVICDGPPGNTLGGRYGLMPLLRHKLHQGATILLDDAERPEEQSVLQQWAKEAGWTYVIKGGREGAHALVTVP